MTCKKLNPHIERYLQMIEGGEIAACKEQLALASHVRRCFETEKIFVNEKQLEHYLGLAKYFPFKQLFPWQEFMTALHLCTYREEDGMPRWADAFHMIGRGAGKDGTIAFESVCLTSPYNGIPAYDVDICANNEEQAMRPVFDVIEAFEMPEFEKKIRKFFYWTKESVRCTRTKSMIKGRTNSPKGKDGLRSGVVIFNEIHQYENYANINVFTTGLGKKKHPRRTYFTTNGDVRDGPLDDLLKESEEILFNGQPDNGLLPFICRLDSKDEVYNPKNWEKANPSLPYLPNLQEEIKKEFEMWKRSPGQISAFMTKRMNLPQSDRELVMTDWENIAATNKPLPDMSGWSCTAGIDYASLSDWAAVNLHFRKGNLRYDINHAWMCLQSKDLERIKAPWQQWAQEGRLTVIDGKEIPPEALTEYIEKAKLRYNIKRVALDSFRYALMKNALAKIGFSFENKNIYYVRPSDIMKVQPVIDSCFTNQLFIWGDNPPLRWGANNTKLIRSGKKEGCDIGNFFYGKIEAKSRKNDTFMALAASMVIEDDLGDGGSTEIPDIGVMIF